MHSLSLNQCLKRGVCEQDPSKGVMHSLSLSNMGAIPTFRFLDVDAVYVYVVPWSEVPIVPSYPHV